MHFKINDKTDDLSCHQSGGFNSNKERANVNKSHRRNATRDNDVETLKVLQTFFNDPKWAFTTNETSDRQKPSLQPMEI